MPMIAICICSGYLRSRDISFRQFVTSSLFSYLHQIRISYLSSQERQRLISTLCPQSDRRKECQRGATAYTYLILFLCATSQSKCHDRRQLRKVGSRFRLVGDSIFLSKGGLLKAVQHKTGLQKRCKEVRDRTVKVEL